MSKRFNVIYADLPWDITAGRKLGEYKMVDGKQIFNNAENKNSRALAYPTMSVEEIKLLPVSSITNKDCHLYIWVTNSHLPFVFGVIESWGFKYSTTLVWAKKAMGCGLGGAFGITTEFLIFARRGQLKTLSKTVGTWFDRKRQYVNGYPQHSKKPDFFYELIEKTSPGPHAELFARNHREGWDVFGNELENTIQLV